MGIYDKFFTYIEHSADLTNEMVKKYENSLIFIGDEQQIYQPLTNSYVGVGLSNLDRISSATFSAKLVSTNTDSTYYITFSSLSNGFSISYTDQNLIYNPYYNKLTVNYFEGDLIGNADTSSRLKGDNSYTAWGNIYWKNGIPNSIEGTIDNTYHITPAEHNTYNIGAVDNNYSYMYASHFAGAFHGNLYGNAETSIYANTTALSDRSYKINIIDVSDTNSYLFLDLNNGESISYLYKDQQFKYNPNSNTLVANHFEGMLEPSLQWGTITGT